MSGATSKTADGPRTWRERLHMLKYVPWLLKLVWKSSPTLCLFSMLLRSITAFLPLGLLWVSKLIVDIVVRVIGSRVPVPHLLWWLMGLEFLLALSADTLARAVTLVDSLLADRFTDQSTLQLMRHASTLDLASFEDPVFYDKLERARRQTTARLGMLTALAVMAQQLLTLLTLLSAVIAYFPWLLVLLLLAMVPVFLGETRSAVLRYSMLYGFTPERRELEYLSFLGTSNSSVKEVKVFGLGEYLVERANKLFEKFYINNRRLAVKRASMGATLNILPVSAYYFAYVLIVLKAVRGFASVGDLTLIVGAYSRARSIMENIVSGLISVSEQALFVKDLHDFVITKPAIVSGPHSVPAPRPISRGFEFRGVSFSYPGSTSQTLSNISFNLRPGERLALVGENGAGKTTLIKLLARFYDPTEGTILLDGVDLREYDLKDFRKEIGVIFQDYVRYDMLVRENIGFGRIEKMQDERLVQQAAERSRASDLIDRLPNRYDQMLGRRFDNGVDLSVGQWQKVALARAYMRDAQVMILDEPTASLDARAEAETYKHFLGLTAAKMAILISHRFSTVRIADRILVLEQGRIVEQGSHDSLVGSGGKYSELFELQASGYR